MKCITCISILIYSEVVYSSQWIVKVPWNVPAVSSSCAEIPCTFDYPYGRNPWGMWLKGGPDPDAAGVTIICDSSNADNIHNNYRGRTEFSGDFTKKQCSLRIKDIRKSDEGNYYFRVTITNSRNIAEQYSYQLHVNLSIVDKPRISVSGELIAGKPTHFTCSVNHSCPSTDIQLMWIHDKVRLPFLPEIKTSKQNGSSFEGAQKVLSTFNFSPSADHHGKKLGCKLLVNGATATLQETLTLDVKSIPQKPNINSSLVTVEGSSLLLDCMPRGSIPANLMLVRSVAEIIRSSTGERTQIFHNSSSEDNVEYWCVIENQLGTTSSSTQISVQYQPSIISGRTCTSSESEVNCNCSVRANPPANITWSLNGRNITGNRTDSKILSSAVNSHLVLSSLTLTHPTGTGYLISCIGANEQGVSVGKYQLQSGAVINSNGFLRILGTFPWNIVIAVLAAAAVLLLILITVKIRRKKTIDTTGVPLTNNDLRQNKCRNIGVRGARSNQSAQSEEVLYAAVSVSKVQKHERYLQNEESSEYAIIKFE